MVDVEDKSKLYELRNHLLKSPTHFGGAKFTRMIRELSFEEQVELFDDEMLKRLERVVDYDSMASVFRAVPASVQEKMWESEYVQKILLGIGNYSLQTIKDTIARGKFFSFQELAKKQKNGKFHYNSVKLRALEVLMRYIKSPKIMEQLHYNQYFQMILLCSKKVPESIYGYINEELIFYQIVRSDFYNLIDTKYRSAWVQQENNNCPKILLPPDVHKLFTESKRYSNWFYGEDARSLAAMLHSKIFALHNKGLKLDVDKETLKRLNLQEINILKSDPNGVVDQSVINSLLEEIIQESFVDGSVFSKKYLDTTNLDVPVQRAMFKIVVDKSIGNPQYENKILEYLFNILFTAEYNELEKKALMISLKNSLVNANEEAIGDLFYSPNDLKSVFFLRFNLTAKFMNYLYGIDVGQLMRINVKHINRIVQLLFDSEQDELSDTYSKAIKMYFVFGLERTLELLSGKYPINKMFLDNVSKLDISKIKMKAEGKKYLPVISTDFNRFLFATDNINALFDADNAISSSWFYLYNNFESIQDLCKGHVTLGKAETILKEQVNKVSYELEPDCYRLENILYEAGLGNKGRSTNEEVYDEMCNIHKKQLKRIESTIPFVSGTLPNGWRYEVMRYDDAIAFVLGYRASCCIRVKDIAHNHLLHALHCENGRILLTYKPDGTIASFSPLKRNGELLIANSIEAIEKNENFSGKITEAFNEGMKAICRVSKENEENGYIKVATIGNASSRKPEGEHWPTNIPTPTIYEKNDPLYGGTDCYHRGLHIFYKDDGVNLFNLKYGKVDKKYLDPRKKIIACLNERDNILMQRKVQRIIDSVRYTKWIDEGNSKKSFENTRLGYFHAIFCNDDWYIVVDYRGIHYECIDNDPRARKEMEATLNVIEEYKNNKMDIRKLVYSYDEKKVK